jgi:hypothetical protein
MARPLKRTHELRQRLDCYLSPTERELVAAKAEEAGLAVSAFVREAVLSRRIAQPPTVSAQRWAELARVCANLNQVTRHLNAGTANGVPPEVVARLLAEVQALRRELLGVSR